LSASAWRLPTIPVVAIAEEDLDDEARAARAAVPEARRPDRRRVVSSNGLKLAVYEWGDVNARPVLLTHGGMDFAGTYDLFAPLLADGGWRVVAWDQRGHGDSEHAALYSWDADVRDALAVMDTLSARAIPTIGHSKGGNMLLQLCEVAPHRLWRFVNIDGMPSPMRHMEIMGHERTRMLERAMHDWLTHRRKVATLTRKPGTMEELAKRRGRMNPR